MQLLFNYIFMNPNAIFVSEVLLFIGKTFFFFFFTQCLFVLNIQGSLSCYFLPMCIGEEQNEMQSFLENHLGVSALISYDT